MSRAFGMLVEEALSVPRRKGVFVLTGPVVGATPGEGQKLLIRGALGATMPARFVGTEIPGGGAVVACADADVGVLRGALVHDESVACRVFGGLLRGEPVRKSTPIRYDLRHGRAFGLLRIDGGVVTAVVVGGGLDLDADLWSELVAFVAPDGWRLEASSVAPIGPTWPVSVLPSQTYDGPGGSVVLARPCGPAEAGSQVLAAVDDNKMATGSVLAQQARGLVHVLLPGLRKAHPVKFVRVA